MLDTVSESFPLCSEQKQSPGPTTIKIYGLDVGAYLLETPSAGFDRRRKETATTMNAIALFLALTLNGNPTCLFRLIPTIAVSESRGACPHTRLQYGR